MDAAVALVEAYLYANGYFTVTEYPIVEALEGGGYRSVTDIDILAVRLPGAGRIVLPHDRKAADVPVYLDPDPAVVEPRCNDWVDLIIGEVKEGKAELNRGAGKAGTLIAAIRRFAFLRPELAERLAGELLQTGRAAIEDRKVQFRLFAFGSRPGDAGGPPHQVVLLRRCIDFLVRHGLEYMEVTSAGNAKNQTFSLMALMAKSGFLGGSWVPREQEDGPERRGKRR